MARFTGCRFQFCEGGQATEIRLDVHADKNQRRYEDDDKQGVEGVQNFSRWLVGAG